MNLLYFSPVSKSSAIGRMNADVVKALMESGHQITVVATDAHPLDFTKTHAFETSVIHWTNQASVSNKAITCDQLVYHIGDNYGFHVGAIKWISRMPGLTCLHDFYLGNLFYGNYAIDRNHQHYFNVVKQLYGEATANSYFIPMSAVDRIERTFQSAPMTEWIASLSSGLITHSSWGLDKITKHFSGPTRVIPLSYLTPHIDIDSAPSVSDKIRILTVGHMNPNKRIDSIIEAISGSPHLKQYATLQLVGPISADHSGKIKALADKLGVSISIHGSVDEDLLRRFFVDADISCCLRNPTLEAASASTIEAMQYGKAVIVLDHGFYKELPDDCVCKIPVDNEVAGLRNQLELLCKDQAYRKRLGEKAKNYAIHTFRPEQYARNIIEMCAQVPKASICRDRVNQATQYYKTMLESWGAGNLVLSHQDVVIPMEFIQKASASSSRQLS